MSRDQVNEEKSTLSTTYNGDITTTTARMMNGGCSRRHLEFSKFAI